MTDDPLGDMIEQTFRESRKEGMSIHDTAQLIASVVREAILDKIGEKEGEGLYKADHVRVQSVVGAASGNPAVQCRVGFEQWQWDPEEAREHARNVMQCAEAATLDAAIIRWATLGALKLDLRAAHRMVYDLRRFRGDVEREDWRPPAQEDVPE